MKSHSKHKRILMVFPHNQGADLLEVYQEGSRWRTGPQTAVHTPGKWDSLAVGELLREALKASGIRCREALVCQPSDLCALVRLPLPESLGNDNAGFLRLQAEAHLPFADGDCAFAWTELPLQENLERNEAVIIGTKGTLLTNWESALRHAHIRYLGTTPAFPPPPIGSNDSTWVSLVSTEHGTSLAVFYAGVPACWRRATDNLSDGIIEEKLPRLMREIRVALAELPVSISAAFRRIDLLSPAFQQDIILENAQEQSVQGLLPPMVAHGGTGTPLEQIACETAAQFASGTTLIFERIVHQNDIPRHRDIQRAAAVAAILVLLSAVGAWWQQSATLRALRNEAEAIAKDVTNTEELRDTVRTLNPWFQMNPLHLEILKAVTEAFPEEGNVYATQLSVKGGEQVTLAGAARNVKDWLQVQEKLRNTSPIKDLQVSQTRADGHGNGVVFTLRFSWQKGR